MQYLVIILGSLLGGMYARENMDKALKALLIILLFFVLYQMGK